MSISDSNNSSDPLIPHSPDDDSPSNRTRMNSKLPVECRVKPSMWWLVSIGLLEAAFMLSGPFFMDASAPKPGPSIWLLILFTWPIALTFTFGLVWMAFDLKFGVIRADEMGLSWRRPFGKLKSARWEEITDYYRTSPMYKLGIVETTVGKVELSRHFADIERIADLVVEKTTHIGNMGWEMKGTRSKENWSRTFTPMSHEQTYLALLMTGLLIIQFLALTIPLADFIHQSRVSMGFWLDTFPLIAAIIFEMLLFGGLIGIIKSVGRERLLASKHRDEKLVLNAKGLTFTSPDRHFETKWQEIEKISLLPEVDGITPVQVETASENFIIWNIAERPQWRRIELVLDQYAAHAKIDHEAKVQQLRVIQSDLQGERGAWNGGAIGVGARRWSFRSRENRLALLTASFVLLFISLLYPISLYNTKEDQPMIISWPLLAGMYLLSALIITVLWPWYYRSEILADEHGLQICSPFRPAYKVAWHEIESIGTDPTGQFIRVGKRKLYFARIFQPVRVEELRAYIEQHMKKG